MKHLNTITMLLAATLALFLTVSCGKSSYVSITGYAQGGTYQITLNSDGASVSPESMKHSIDSILNVVDFSLSGYNKESLLSKFNAGETIVPNEMLMDLYARSYDFWKTSEGVLDVAAGPLFDIWGFGFTEGEMPSDEQVAVVLANCGMARLIPDMHDALSPDGKLSPADLVSNSRTLPDGGQIHLPASLEDVGTLPKLNFNAVAQGYSVDLVASYLYSVGVKDMLINIGGEIFCDGVNPSGNAWTLGIDKPEDGNNVTGAMVQGVFHSPGGPCGIVTSGNYRKFYVKDGKKYSHSIDPRKGYPVSHSLLSATVIDTTDGGFLSTRADALATICMVLGLEDAGAMVEAMPGIEACLIYDEAGEMKAWTSSSFVLE